MKNLNAFKQKFIDKLGQFAKTVDRNKIIISDKARYYDGGQIYEAVERSSKNLSTIPDIYFVHQVDTENQDMVFGKYGALRIFRGVI